MKTNLLSAELIETISTALWAAECDCDLHANSAALPAAVREAARMRQRTLKRARVEFDALTNRDGD